MTGGDDPDRTVVLRRGPGRRRWLPFLGAGVIVLSAASAAIGLWRRTPAIAPAAAIVAPQAPETVAPLAVPVPLGPVTFPVIVANEAEILANQPTDMTVFRFRANPAIVVLDFANLADQAEMLNRMAVFEEKAGYPHDRVLTNAELDHAIRDGGDEPATFYYGHDYRAAALLRFFAAAARDHVVLTDREGVLRLLMRQLGWESPGAVGALISLPRLTADPIIDTSTRATILRHELSHGEYFTTPAYADFAQRFWRETMSETDRRGFRGFLVADHYDPGIEDLMINESQAYLMHTRDARFFTPAFVNLPSTRIEDLRNAFAAGMPGGWLRDATVPDGLPASPPAPAGTPRRRRYGFGAVSRTRASAARRASCRRAASMAVFNASR